MEVVRTPDERFMNLPEYPFQPNYVEVPSGAVSGVSKLRIHYVDEGPRDAKETIVCMHGQPSWSFLYRKMVPFLTAAGHRVLCPDLVGYGRSDKPTQRSDHTYAAQVQWMSAWFLAMDLSNVTLMAQDWGGLVGLRVVAAHESRFARIAVANTSLPTGPVPGIVTGPMRQGFEQLPVPKVAETVAAMEERPGISPCSLLKMIICRSPPAPADTSGFLFYIKHCSEDREMTVREFFKHIYIVQKFVMTEEVLNAYGAPFPDEEKERYMAAPRQYPNLIPLFQNGGFQGVARDVEDNKAAWLVLEKWEKPFLCAFSDKDPSTIGGEKVFQEKVPGAWKTQHLTIKGGGHFLQEDKPRELSEALLEFIAGKRHNPNGKKPGMCG